MTIFIVVLSWCFLQCHLSPLLRVCEKYSVLKIIYMVVKVKSEKTTHVKNGDNFTKYNLRGEKQQK